MVINGVSGNAQMGSIGMSRANDPVVKDIERQIADAQKQLQELAANKELSSEDKMKKRQELQQKINDLNMQLRQHQIEQRREKQQEKSASSSDDIFDPNGQSNGSKTKNGQKSAGLSQSSMEAMISADTSMKQAAVQGSVATKMEGRADVLKVEIQLDGSRGIDTERKQSELASMEKKAQEATSSQLGTLAETNKNLQNAANEEQNASDDKKAEDNKAEDNNKADTYNSEDASGNNSEELQSTIYRPVDVRL